MACDALIVCRVCSSIVPLDNDDLIEVLHYNGRGKFFVACPKCSYEEALRPEALDEFLREARPRGRA